MVESEDSDGRNMLLLLYDEIPKDGENDKLFKELRILRYALSNVEIRLVDCQLQNFKENCKNLYLGVLPKAALFRSVGGFDIHYGLIFCCRGHK